MKYFLLTIFCIINCFFFKAQVGKCSFPKADEISLNKIRKTKISNQKTTTLIFPVVFHVIHAYGSENLADSVLQKSIEYTNEDFSGLFVDTSEISNWFDTIIGQTNFEFRLATIDPNGNPTNGIERIASTQTSNPDVSVFSHNWDESKYINVYVFKEQAQSLFPYTMYQNGVCGRQLTVNAINLLYIDIKHTLSHEMGHFFGLFHTFGDEFTCDDGDGLADTPYQKLTFGGCLINNNVCNDSIYPSSFAYWGQDPPDNSQNIMGWTECKLMFTIQQSALMRSNAINLQYDLWNLHTDSNLIATGVGPNLYIPSQAFTIDFWNSSTVVCESDSIDFYASFGGVPNMSFSWSFQGGNPASSSEQNPTVFYPSSGNYEVQLIVSNGLTNDTIVKNRSIHILPSFAENNGPFTYDFDANSSNWIVLNSEENSTSFELQDSLGVANSSCYQLINDFDEDTTQTCWYSNSSGTLGSNLDALVSPSFDLRYTSNATIDFDYAYASAVQPNASQFTEELKLFVSKDCGETWQLKSTLFDSILFCNSAIMGSNFIPLVSDWKHFQYNYSTTNLDDRTRFMLAFKAANFSNNLYIDNFAINGVLSANYQKSNQFSVFPNPVSEANSIQISTVNSSLISEVNLLTLDGKKMSLLSFSLNNFQLPSQLISGFYFLEISSGNFSEIHKIQVFN